MNTADIPHRNRPATPVVDRLRSYARLARLDKPVGIYLLLWPTLDALFLASGGWPGWRRLVVFTLGTVLTRSAGCVVNDLADRRFDGSVERTANRELVAGRIGVRAAWLFALALGLASAACLPFLAPEDLPLAFVAVGLAVSYPFFKRFFPLPQAWLGLAFSFGIPMAAMDVWGRVPPWAWALFLGNLCWVIAYDTEYAMVDRDDDLRIGVKSSAVFFGRWDLAAIACCYGMHLAVLFAVTRAFDLGWRFDLAWLIAAGMAVQHLTWIRGRQRQDCFRAFRHNHWLGLALFAGIVAGFLGRS